MEYSTDDKRSAAIFSDSSFSKSIIQWQKQHGRHHLPWQNTRDPYRIWLSEIMLQQTQVATVTPYYLRFLASFPNVQALADAPTSEVMAHWSGLGYYARARNLHDCARRVVAEYGGTFPHDLAQLQSLPGIGRSTAAAITVFSHGTKAAILDGNVKRVFARVFGIDSYTNLKFTENKMWSRAIQLLPCEGIAPYTQGLMDLGSTVCTPRKPQCHLCPISKRCVALATNKTNVLPVRKKKRSIPQKDTCMLIIVGLRQVILEQRPGNGLWGNLLSLPEIYPGESFSADLSEVVSKFGSLESLRPLKPILHTLTHLKLHISLLQVFLSSQKENLDTNETYSWYPIDKLPYAPLPAPVKSVLTKILCEEDQVLSQKT